MTVPQLPILLFQVDFSCFPSHGKLPLMALCFFRSHFVFNSLPSGHTSKPCTNYSTWNHQWSFVSWFQQVLFCSLLLWPCCSLQNHGGTIPCWHSLPLPPLHWHHIVFWGGGPSSTVSLATLCHPHGMLFLLTSLVFTHVASVLLIPKTFPRFQQQE